MSNLHLVDSPVEKAGFLTLCLLSLLHHYIQQTMQNNVSCALVWFPPFQIYV